MSRPIYGLSPGRLAAIVLGAAVVPAVLLTAPAIAGQLAAQLGLGPAQIGAMFSCELAAMSFATIPAWWWQKRVDWRRVAFAAGLLFIAANVASAFATAYAPLLVLRFISAIGGGTVMIVCMSSAAASPERDRVYGLWVCGQLVLGALGLWVLPGLFTVHGLAALYVGLAILLSLCLPLFTQFPAGLAAPAARTTDTGGQLWRPVLAIGAVLTFYVGLSGVWSFIGTIAGNSGLDAATSGAVLAVASLLGIAGSLTATGIGGRIPRGLSLAAGYAAMTASVMMLFGLPGLVQFAAAAFIFKFVWTFVLPFILASVADLDRDGRLMSMTNLVIGGGLAIGPAISGQILEGVGHTNPMLATSVVFLVLSFAAISLSRLTRTRAEATTVEPAR